MKAIISHVKKIAVLRALVLGDLIFILPALEALRQTYPETEIVYLARPWASEFVRDRVPTITRVEPMRPSLVDFEDLGFLIHPEDAQTLIPRMRAEHFDLAFAMQGGGNNSNPFIRRLGARVAIGSREAGAIPLDRWLPHDYYQHDVIRNLELVGLAGARPLSWTPRLPVLQKDRDAAHPFLQSIKRSYVMLHSGARDIRRRWPPEQFAALADALQCEFDVGIVLTGTDVDEQSAAAIAAMARRPVINLSGRLTLSALIGVLANTKLLISNDTGVLHLGLAVGTQAVGLYWGEYISKSLPLSRER